ncbi:MAG: hypothetical protein C4297_03490 [Gemmataceae bacterium]
MNVWWGCAFSSQPGAEPDDLEQLRGAFARLPIPAPGQRPGPQGLTVAISREAGSRGGTIARKVSTLLGWQLYDQELLEYLAQERHLERELFEHLDPEVQHWVTKRLDHLQQSGQLTGDAPVVELARVVLTIGYRGEAVILGRGAGCLLEPSATLHVRIVAPVEDRVVYMSQLERMSRDSAAREVAARDAARAQFIATHFHRQPGDIYQYDMVLNSSLLGEDVCARLVVEAARLKSQTRCRQPAAPPPTMPEELA